MFATRRLFSYKKLNEKSSEFLMTTAGRRLRIGLLGGTIVAYPLFSLITNGPLINWSFPYRHKVQDLNEPLNRIAQEEYQRFLEREGRIAKDAVVTHHINTSFDDYDTVAAGSLGVRTGLHLAVPFYTQFTTAEEALSYLRIHHPESVEYLGQKLKVNWDMPSGEELAQAFVLSDKAIKFIMFRDLYAHDGYAALAQRSISWATWTSFTSIFTYWLHKSAKVFRGSAVSFAGIYCIFVTGAWFANKHWHYLYRYVTDVFADSTSAKSSFDHSQGGKEFYWLQLKRNRLLRDMNPSLKSLITPSGDIRGLPTSILIRFDHLKDVSQDDDELKQSASMDD